MKLPLSFIKKYVDIGDISYKEFEHSLTMSGSKVEGFLDIGSQINNVKTGKITKIEKHPDADKLSVCQVDIGNEQIQIVTAATNMKEEDIVPVALHKSTIFGGHKIENTKLRGVLSNGMFCSVDELGIGDPTTKASGILILPKNTPLGQDIKDTLSLNDAIFEFEITSNRPDCLSAIGMARETAATFHKKLNVKTPSVTESGGSINDYLKVSVLNSDLCKRYSARVVTDIKIGESPEWLKRILIGCGVRPINNIVDITNFVMLEYGQPMHAFDISLVDGSEIVVRNAKNDEKITTLDGIERALTDDMLVICDAKKPVAVAGVMGGEYSGIIDNTKTIVFESASFLGTSIRKTAKKLGLRTESSQRFEKGLDKEMVISALDRACELVCELECGKVVSGIIDIDTINEPSVQIPFDVKKINAFLGADISENEMRNALLSLEFKIENGFVLAPSFRIDIERFCDIAEEVARIYGYDKIPSAELIGNGLVGGLNKEQTLEKDAKIRLTGQGFCEVYTYSFEAPKVFDMLNIPKDSQLRNAVTILNPLGQDMSIMRTSPLFGMLSALSNNEKKRAKSAYLFEIGKTYISGQKDELPFEPKNITIGAYGDCCDFFHMKGVVLETLKVFGMKEAVFVADSSNSSFHPYKTAKILYNDIGIGIIGQIHPVVQENFSISKETYIAILDFTKIISLEIKPIKYKQLNKFPSSEKDFSVVVEDSVTAFDIEKTAKKVAGNMLTQIALFDVYRGNQIPKGKKSVSFSFVLEDYTKTLTDEETNGMLNKIIDAIIKEHNAELR